MYYDCINIALCHFDISCSPPSSFPKDFSVQCWQKKLSKAKVLHERVIDCSCFPTFKGCLLPTMLRLCRSFSITFLPHCWGIKDFPSYFVLSVSWVLLMTNDLEAVNREGHRWQIHTSAIMCCPAMSDQQFHITCVEK